MQPQYKLRDDHVMTVKHGRDERIRNDSEYRKKTDIINAINNSTNQSQIICNTDRFIAVRSNGNKICDIHEDEINQGFTLNTYNRRLNLVSEQPQTLYHNSNTGLFNFKFTGTNDISTPNYSNFGMIQIAPSGVTNLNPAINIISSRVNNFGSVGSLYLDSTYGNIETPLIIAPQSLTDANGTQMIQYRSTATPILKTQFQGKTGYSSNITIDQPNQFTSKNYVDNLVQSSSGTGITQAQADARYYLNTIRLNQIQQANGTVNLGGQILRNISNAFLPNDAVNLNTLNAALSQVQNQKQFSIDRNFDTINQSGVSLSVEDENIRYITFQNGNQEVNLNVFRDETSTTIQIPQNRDLVLSNQNSLVKIKENSVNINKKILYDDVTQTYSTVADNEIIQKICLESRLSDFALTSSLNNYLTLTNAAQLYLSQTNANANYLQKNDAESLYLRLNTSNAPANLSFPDTFISTKTPTQNQHVCTKLYTDNLPAKSLLQNTVNAQLQLQSSGNLDLTSGATTFYSIENTSETVTSNRLTKRRFKMQQLNANTPMDFYLKNLTNTNGLIMSSGFNDGINTDTSILPYIGVSSELDNTITPMIQLNSTNNNVRVFQRLFKSQQTNIGDTANDEILSKQEIIQLIQQFTGNGYRQGWIQTVNGDLSNNPPASFTFSGLPISTITHTGGQNIFFWNITLSQDLGFDYQVYTQLRSNTTPTTNDNDTFILTVQQLSRLQFRISFEEMAASQQNVRVNVLLMPILP